MFDGIGCSKGFFRFSLKIKQTIAKILQQNNSYVKIGDFFGCLLSNMSN